jgi:hypothetical protein
MRSVFNRRFVGKQTVNPVTADRRRSAIWGAIEALETRRLLTSVVVNSTLDNVNDSVITGPSITLREAVNYEDHNGGGTITFAPSVFGTAKTIALASQLNLTNTNSLTITGPGAGLLTISGQNATRVLYMNGGAATLSGLTISGGNASGGAGLDVISGTVTLTNVTVANNTAQGDGIFDYGGGVNTQSFGSVILGA